MVAGGAEAADHDRRAVRGVGGILGGVRAGGLDAQPVRRARHATTAAGLRVPGRAGTSRFRRSTSCCWRRCSPGCGCGWATGSRRARRSSSLGLVFVGLGFVILVPAAGLAASGVKVSPGWLMVTYLLHVDRRAVPQPGGPERHDQARAGPGGRPDDGRLVSLAGGGELSRRAHGRAVRVDSAPHAVRRRRRVRDPGGVVLGVVGEADRADARARRS